MAEEETPQAATPATPGRRSLLARLAVAGLVTTVIGVECLVAYLCIPSSDRTAAMAADVVKASEEAKSPAHGEAGESKQATNAEVDLGEFCVTAYQPASGTTLRIDFHLYGSVSSEAQEEFSHLFDENKHRFREQVLTTVRSASMSDLADPGLGLIKRAILDKTRRMLGKPLLQEVLISDYAFVEQ